MLRQRDFIEQCSHSFSVLCVCIDAVNSERLEFHFARLLHTENKANNQKVCTKFGASVR